LFFSEDLTCFSAAIDADLAVSFGDSSCRMFKIAFDSSDAPLLGRFTSLNARGVLA
jgi:hypothetical protein